MEFNQKCGVIGCRKLAEHRGYCGAHYKRLIRHGDVNHNARPKIDGFENNRDHPLYRVWRTITRKDRGTQVVSEWKKFEDFISSIKIKPSDEHQFRRLDPEQPFGPNNYYWAAPLGLTIEKKEYLKEKLRIKRAADPDYSTRNSLKKLYGITLEQYQEMHESQGGVCKICGKTESSKDYKYQKIRKLAVDHCHTTNKIRGLLCGNCNSILGHAKDSKDVLLKCIAYLSD